MEHLFWAWLIGVFVVLLAIVFSAVMADVRLSEIKWTRTIFLVGGLCLLWPIVLPFYVFYREVN